MTQGNASYGLQTRAQVISTFTWASISKEKSCFPAQRQFGSYTCTTQISMHNKTRLLLLDTGIRCLWQLLWTRWETAIPVLLKATSQHQHHCYSQAGVSTEGQHSKWAKEPNPLSPGPVSSLQEKLRHIWCREERSREKEAFRCCAWKDMTPFVLSTKNVWVQCWQSGSDWMLSSSLRRDKQKGKKK